MSQPFVGEVRLFGFNFAPRGWALCRGQLLSISQNTALFSLIGTYYGGNGTSTFALPNLQGNIAVGQGQGIGLSNYTVGQIAGSATVTLLANQLPPHSHTLVAGTAATTPTPAANAYFGSAPRGRNAYATSSDGTRMAAASVATSGSSTPHNNMMPYLAMNYCISLQGIFPSRN